MKIQPVASPHAIQTANTTNNTEARARAIAKLTPVQVAPTQGQAQEHPVQNANNISVEELSAIKGSQSTEITDVSTEVIAEVPAKVETKVEDTPESRRWAQLARQERALRAKAQQQEQAYKAREDALKAQEAALQAKSQTDYTGYISRDQLKSNTLSALAEAGISYDALTQQIIDQSANPVNPQVQAHIARLEAQIQKLTDQSEQANKGQEQRAQEQYQAALRQIEVDTVSLVKAEAETYEAISKMGKPAIKEVVKLIEETYKKDNVLMTVEEAAKEVEEYLVEETFKSANSINKIKNRLTQASATQAKTDVKTQATAQQTQPKMTTLTNAAASTRRLSARERALLAFKGELKS